MSSTQFEAGPDHVELMHLTDMWWLTPAELEAQFTQATIGDTIVYGVGQLNYAREFTGSAEKIAIATNRLFSRGKAQLATKKLGPGKYEYWLVKR